MTPRPPSPDWLATHRRVWAAKRSVRLVYGQWFETLRAACTPEQPVVELGCGPGLFKERYPDVIATDSQPNPYADRVVDAARLPFESEAIANLVMLDVFHHLPHPADFLGEAARTLRPGGRLVMIEPWMGLAGRVFFRHVHHEECDLSVDPAAPWAQAEKDPMQGNVALPYLYFRSGGHLERLDLPLRVVRRHPFAALSWLLSGGFQTFNLLPATCIGAVNALDGALSRLARLTATRCMLIIEKVEGSTPATELDVELSRRDDLG